MTSSAHIESELLVSTLVTHVFELVSAPGFAQVDQRLLVHDGYALEAPARASGTRGSAFMGSGAVFGLRG